MVWCGLRENANFGRNFRIKERYDLSIRVEFTHIFNRLQLPQTIGLGDFAAAPTKFTSGANDGLYTGQRAGTLVARFTF